MDSLDGTRAQMMAAIDSAMENGVRASRDRASGQSGLFAALIEEQPTAHHTLPNVPDWTPQEKLTSEKEMLGFYVTGHPLDQYRDKVPELVSHTTALLEGLTKGNEVALCGVLVAVNRRRTKEGKPWASFQIEDLEGAVEAMVFSTQYERLNSSLVEDKAVLVRGLVLPEENAPPKISVQDVVPMDVVRVNLPSLISIKVPVNGSGAAVDRAAALLHLFQTKPGQTEVRLRLEKPKDFSVILDLVAKVRPDKAISSRIGRHLRPGSARSARQLEHCSPTNADLSAFPCSCLWPGWANSQRSSFSSDASSCL